MSDSKPDSDDDRPLAGLPPLAPPPGLEDAVVARLHRSGLLRASHRPGILLFAWAASLLIALFAGGRLAAGSSDATVERRGDYLLLLSRTPPLPADQLAARIAEYGAWARELHDAGALVAAERLADDGLTLGPASDAPSASGYFLLAADTPEAARRFAQDCPHLRHGGALTLHALTD